MDRATRDAVVNGYEKLIPSLTLPDPKDRHILAAAIVGRCDVIVTQNLRDFPEEALSPFGGRALRTVRLRLRNPPYTVDQYLETLTRQGLVETVSELKGLVTLL
jgi:hypothetical protein